MPSKTDEIALSERVTADYQRGREALARQRERAKDEPSPEDFVYPDGVVPRWQERLQEEPIPERPQRHARRG